MISEKDRKFLKKTFSEQMKDEVRALIFTQETGRHFRKEARQIEAVASNSDKIKVEKCDFVKDKEKVEEYQIKRIPAIAFAGKVNYGIRFYGIPSGYEFSAFTAGYPR